MKMKITIDRNIDTIPTDYSWQFGLGNDHAFQLHRTDVCEHVKLAHDELGIKYLRFHGLFNDDMLTYQRLSDYFRFRGMPYSRQIEEVNFRQVGHVLDNLLDCGVKPFVELSFMPTALARGRKRGFRYNNNITLPKSFDKWAEHVRRLFGLSKTATVGKKLKRGTSRYGMNLICLYFLMVNSGITSNYMSIR